MKKPRIPRKQKKQLKKQGRYYSKIGMQRFERAVYIVCRKVAFGISELAKILPKQ